MSPLPTGTVTFLRTDVEGSMGLVRALGPDWDTINTTHLGILRDAVERNGGVCVRSEGDALFAAFPEAGAAVVAAIDGQVALDGFPWPERGQVRVRMGLHTGEAHLAGDDYGGFDVNRAARVAAVGHGGQIVVSSTTHALVSSGIGRPFSLRDLGRHVLKDIPEPEHLFQVDAQGRRADFPPLRIAEAATGNLPDRTTSFIGRARELADLRDLLESNRLLTLTGPGGIGKSSLAVEAAREGAASFPDGAWFVPLETVTDPALVGSAIARSLGVFDGVERAAAEALPGFVAGRSMLLVLDNFEQVLDAATVVAILLRASPGSRFLVTSRAPLHLSGEQEYPVVPLTADATTDPATGGMGAAGRLFVERARSVRPGWAPGADASVVAEICDLLDGLPLGIELAAARLSNLPVAAIRDRLATHAPLPGSGPRDVPARQRTLEATIEWSHDLLAPGDQRMLHALGVFEGTFDAQQVRRVVDPEGVMDAIDGLVALADQSLITRDPASLAEDARLEATGIRFGMLRTVQVFAAARLADAGRDREVHDRHAEAYLGLAEAAAVHLNSARQPVWLDRLSRDDANLRAALRWSIATGDVDAAQRMLAAQWRYWLLDGRLGEGSTWVDEILAMPGAERPTKVRIWALSAAGGIAYWRADSVASQSLYQAQFDLATELDDPRGLADACENVASARFVAGDWAASQDFARESRRLYEALDDPLNVNRVDWSLTSLAILARGPREALPAINAMRDRAEALGDAPYVALGAGTLAWAHFMLGDAAEASQWVIRSMLGNHAIRDLASTTVALPIGAIVALEAGRPVDAAVILGTFEALSERYGVKPPAALATLIDMADPLVRVRSELAPDILADALDRGRRLTIQEALEIIVDVAAAGRPMSD